MDNMEEKKENLIQVDLREIMETSFLDYSMSVIVQRALPDVREGLKPVHRRILYTMYENALWPEKAYRKCADTVGSVLGRYHPHGDASVYDALVRLAQDFSMRYMLIDGHGNFGSVDGDPPAAYRYTEARMSKLSVEMLKDIEKDTVEFSPHYDDRLQEPYRRALIPDYDAIRETCLTGGAKTMWISGSGSTLMAVTDDTIVAKFLQVRLRERFPECVSHILTCDTDGAQIEYL